MPSVTRLGDLGSGHGCFPPRVSTSGSSNVFVNNIAWSCQGDVNTVHLLPGAPCPSHQRPIAIGSTTVFVNDVGAGRIGYSISD